MKTHFEQDRFDTVIETLIDRICDFKVTNMWIGITDVRSGSTEYTTVKYPASIRRDMEALPDFTTHCMAFARFFPEEMRKIFAAVRGDEIILTLETLLDKTEMNYVVICSISEKGISNVVINEKLKVEGYTDENHPRIYNDFFMGED